MPPNLFKWFTGNVNYTKDNKLPSIDFIKVELVGISPEILEENSLLDFCSMVNTDTGFIRAEDRKGNYRTPRRNAYHKDLEFTIYSTGTITLNGSLHKYWNGGGHNFNDFNLDALIGVLRELKELFGVDPSQMLLRQLELGVNVITPMPAKDILDSLFMHKTKPFTTIYNSDEGHYKQSAHSRYIVKVYDKAKHYRKKKFIDVPPRLIRFEIKFRKMEYLNGLGIYTMQDLLNHGLHKFTQNIVDRWNECLYYDSTIVLNSPLLDRFNNPKYWEGLADDKKPTFNKQRRRLNNMIENHSKNIKGQIAELIKTKSDEMTRGHQMDSLYIQSKPLPHASTERVCEITGINIGMQRKNSKYLCVTGLRYYYNTDKKIYRELERKYLSDKWRDSPLKKQFEEIAHNIRNAKFNPIHNLRRRAARIFRHPVLFDPNTYRIGNKTI